MPKTTINLTSAAIALAPVLFVLLWSTGFIGARYGLPYIEPLTFLAVRMVFVVLILGSIALISRARWPNSREVAYSLLKFVNGGASTGAVNFPEVELAQQRGTHRILNVHRNVPGVLRDINKIVSDLSANIHSQILSTDANIGYLIMDLDQDVSDDVRKAMAALSTNIRTRILY